MMFGMLKDLGSKLVAGQSKTCHRRAEALAFLPQDVVDHLLVEKRRHPASSKKKLPKGAARAAVLV